MTISPDRHLDQARRNLAHAQFLLADHADDPTVVQWAVTATFYCAVHCVQSYLVRRGRKPSSHVERAFVLADHALGVPPDVQDAYRFLKHRSEAARYRLVAFDPAFVERRLIGDSLASIARFVNL